MTLTRQFLTVVERSDDYDMVWDMEQILIRFVVTSQCLLRIIML